MNNPFLEIPIIDPGGYEAPETVQHDSTGKNRRVLVIDDNLSIHDDFRKILCPPKMKTSDLEATEAALFGSGTGTAELAHFHVDSAYQGQEGFLLVKKAVETGLPYAMAFVDVRMPPGWDGVETVQKIWEVDPDIQIVLCTAFSDYSWSEMFQKLGQRDGLLILKKPFDTVEAFQLAHALTEKRWLHHQSKLRMEDLERLVGSRTAELQWRKAFLEAQVNSSIDGVLVVDQQGNKSLQNQRFVELFKIPRQIAEEKLDENQLRWLTGITKDPERFIGKIDHLYAHPDETSRDEIELKDGSVLDRYSSPVVGEDGKYYGRIWTFRDITDQKLAEQALKESEERFAGAFEQAPIGVALVSPDGHWLKVNRALCDLVGYSGEELLKKTFHEITHPEDLDLDLDNVRRLLAGEIINYEMEKRYIHQQGHPVTVMLSVSLVRDRLGQPRYFISQIQNISGRKMLEAQLVQSQRLETVGRLAGGIAHEFNSILTTILGNSELLLRDLPGESRTAKNATEIKKAADRAASLTRQLLAYGRRQFLQPEILDLNRVVTSLEIHQIMGSHVDTHVVSASNLHMVKADLGQIEQVIRNIVGNARDAMPNGGKITLETVNITFDPENPSPDSDMKPGDYVMLAITDTGSGMSPENRARLFEPFFSTKAVGQGTGLGLSTCYGIIKQSGGHITVYSEPGRGATFKIFLPQAGMIEKIPAQRSEAPDLPKGTETILLVEDDPSLRELAAEVLGVLGYHVLVASDGVEAMKLLSLREGERLDLLFTDVVMPQMSGRELSEKVLALLPQTKILYTSGYTGNAIVHQGDLDHAAAFLQKPYSPMALAQKLRAVLDSGQEELFYPKPPEL